MTKTRIKIGSLGCINNRVVIILSSLKKVNHKPCSRYEFCLFSKNEGLGMSLIEGCMFYKPLITNNIKAVLEVNKPGFNGFVAHNFNELSDVLNNLPDRDSDEYKKLAGNARKIYEKYFTSDIMLKKYRAIIKNL